MSSELSGLCYYLWFSKILKETVEAYGKHNHYGDFPGPFFCGMSKLMTMPQFAINLLSPTSIATSGHIEVAMNFSGEDGIVIEFDNNGGMATQLKGLDVSWVSRFNEEDERYLSTETRKTP